MTFSTGLTTGLAAATISAKFALLAAVDAASSLVLSSFDLVQYLSATLFLIYFALNSLPNLHSLDVGLAWQILY